MGPAQLPRPVQLTLHSPSPQVTPPAHDPAPEHPITQSPRPPQSIGPSQLRAPRQATAHSPCAGHVIGPPQLSAPRHSIWHSSAAEQSTPSGHGSLPPQVMSQASPGGQVTGPPQPRGGHSISQRPDELH